MIQAIVTKPELGESTPLQTVLIQPSYDGELPRNTVEVGTFSALRVLRKDPTVALGRGLLVSGILAGAWSVEADEDIRDDIVTHITSTLLPLRESIMQACIAFGRVDFGFMPFEKIFAIKDDNYTIERMKPLLHDMTTILVDPYGNFAGFKQSGPGQAIGLHIPREKCLLVNFEVEGGNLYGYPLLENVRAIQTMWDDANAGAKRYDTKIAGSHFIVHYPPGSSDVDGETVENSVIAQQLLTALESSGSMAMPSTTADYVQELNDINVAKLYQWDVTLLSDTSARQPTFIERLKQLDGLKLRGLGVPERTCTEGQYGTKAESETHVDLLITTMEQIDRHITQIVNDQVVDQLLTLNWGAAYVDKVRLVAAPLVDKQITFLRKLYLPLAGKQIDIVALQTKLGIPLGEVQPEPKPTGDNKDDNERNSEDG